MQTDSLVQLDPSKVQAEGNIRFGLKKSRLDSLKQSILETGGVLQPVIVEPLDTPVNGFTHRLVAGFYRHAAVAALNAEQGAGLTLPAALRKPADSTQRLKEQLAENMERENMSPMDAAVAIKQLMDSGVARTEIRRLFARPSGKKGNVMEPASNAWVNIVLRFLELPKAIQAKIHDGSIGVEAAYELGKVPPEKRQAVIERAEADRQRQIDIEAKDEEKYLTAEKKLADATETVKTATSKVDEAKAAIAAAEQIVKDKQAALKAVQKEPYLELDDKGKSELKEKLKAAEKDVKGADKILKDAKNELAKLLTQASKAEEVATEQRAKLAAARKAVKPADKKGKDAKKPIGKADVQKAAAAEGVSTGAVPLNASEIRTVLIKDLSKQKDYPKVAKLAEVFKQAVDGVLTSKQAAMELARITGEAK